MPDIDFGQLSEALNDKADTDLRNVDTTTKADAVIDYQEPTSANNYTWYRKYKSGWVEQGGRVQLNGTISATNKRVTFPVEMVNTQYVASAASNANVASPCFVGWESTTGMSIGVVSGSNTGWTTWQVSGMAA